MDQFSSSHNVVSSWIWLVNHAWTYLGIFSCGHVPSSSDPHVYRLFQLEKYRNFLSRFVTSSVSTSESEALQVETFSVARYLSYLIYYSMAPLADFLLAYAPLPSVPRYLTSYVPGETPLSTTPAVLTTLVSYLAVVFGVQALMQNQKARKLTLLFQAHNILLSGGSLLLLVLMLEEMLPKMWRNGIYHAMCHEESWTNVSLLLAVSVKIMPVLNWVVANGILLHDQLLFQVSRAAGYGLPRFQEKTPRHVFSNLAHV